MVPKWSYPVQIYRNMPTLPLSREKERLEQLYRALVFYRLVFDQPRQEDLSISIQRRAGAGLDLEELGPYQIDLSPWPV